MIRVFLRELSTSADDLCVAMLGCGPSLVATDHTMYPSPSTTQYHVVVSKCYDEQVLGQERHLVNDVCLHEYGLFCLRVASKVYISNRDNMTRKLQIVI